MRSALIIGGRQDGEWISLESDTAPVARFVEVEKHIDWASEPKDPGMEPEYVIVGNSIKVRQVRREPRWEPPEITFKTTDFPIRRLVLQETGGRVVADAWVAHHPDIDPLDVARRARRYLSGSASGKAASPRRL